MGLADDLAAHLQTRGAGTVGVDLFVGQLPPLPANAMAVIEYSGAPPLRVFGATPAQATAQEDARAQVVIRALTHAAARDAAQTALDALDWQMFTGLSGYRYQLVEALQRPAFPLYRDANDRPVWVANFRIRRCAT
jgi:Bacteriophage minor capsid protein